MVDIGQPSTLLDVKIDHHAQIEPALGRADAGDISHPLDVRLGGPEFPVEVVGQEGRPHAARLAPPPKLWDSLQPAPSHASSDSVAAHGLALVGQFFIHLKRTHCAVAPRVAFIEPHQQGAILGFLTLMGLLAQP
jgi:hypothetical protein